MFYETQISADEILQIFTGLPSSWGVPERQHRPLWYRSSIQRK